MTLHPGSKNPRSALRSPSYPSGMAGRLLPMENRMSFEHLPPLLSGALTRKGYESLTPVQAQVTQPEAEGRDLIVSAQTGSGKTVAFGLAKIGRASCRERVCQYV